MTDERIMMDKSELIEELLRYRYAHRGLHSKPQVPENSLAAFAKAAVCGFGIELDVHLTIDQRLAVIHDSSLKRTCGTDLLIEEITMDQAGNFFLEESNEKIPEFEEVLEMIGGKVPLIIELKTRNKNHAALCKRVLGALEGYEGMYCIESFDPAAVQWLRKYNADTVRGQLAGSLRGEGPVNAIQDFLLKNLWVNLAGKPDFVAYRFEDRNERAFRRYKGAKFLWTIRKPEDLKKAEALGASAIFEKFIPDDNTHS